MNNKKQELVEQIEALIIWVSIKIDQYVNGELTDEQMEYVLNYAEEMNDELIAEFKVMELLDNVCMN